MLDISREAIWVFLKIAIPILLTALSVGFFISLIQAMTQIQENTLSFVPKLVIVLGVIMGTASYATKTLMQYMENIISIIVKL